MNMNLLIRAFLVASLSGVLVVRAVTNEDKPWENFQLLRAIANDVSVIDRVARTDIAASLNSPSEFAVRALSFVEDNADINKKDRSGQVCYGELGCYTDDIGRTLPTAPHDIDPFYSFNELYKPSVNVSWKVNQEQLSQVAAGFFSKKERPLVIVAHGFGESLRKQWVRDLNAALLKAYKGDAVTMLIDWSKGSYLPLYSRASANVPLVSKMTLRVVEQLMAAFPTVKAENIHFVGFSLGGQMSGFFARQFFNETGERIGHITALDTAAPNFESRGIMPRRGEASFVEAVHTAAGGNIFTGKVGVVQPYADVDFYPNGGIKQLGCSIFIPPCSHQRAFSLYTDALNELDHCQIRGNRCKDVKSANEGKCTEPYNDAYLGMLRPTQTKANFTRLDDDFRIVYFKTNDKSPFCVQS